MAARYPASAFGPLAMLDGLMAARMIAVIERDGQRDEVAVEEPMEIRVDGQALSVTMRTPGHDEELALGFLLGEGLIDGVRPAGLTEDLANNIVEVGGPLTRDPSARRFYTTSSCGVCGRGSLEEVAVNADVAAAGPVLARDLLADLPARLRQPGFARTGGLHATGLFSPGASCCSSARTSGATTRWTRSSAARCSTGCSRCTRRVLCVSGRLSFELVQKAAVAGAPMLVGVGAPTSLAIDLAADRGLTLAGFARGGTVNVYTHPERVG